ncbi:MAG TPA: MarR family transcriptional regulator [bacterium]|nr:MarR family transcriptional regulator [bacterium]
MKTITRPTRPSAAADACATRLVDVAPLAVRFVRAQMRRQMPGLTMAQFRAMSFVYRRGGCSLRALADHLGVTPPSGSALVDRLVSRGVVTRAPNPASRREVSLHLTRTGRTQFEAAKDAAREKTAGVLATLPDVVLRRMTQDLDALAAAFTIAEVNPDR